MGIIINNDNFLVKDVPKFHPISQRYDRISYWKEEKRKCIEGSWSSGKWMPGPLYFFANYHTIRFEDEGGTSRRIGRPWLRDIDWEKAYVYEEATGFSGFSGDTLYTCDRKYGPEKERALKYGWITEDEAASKIYTPAREYLRKIHPANLGKPLYRNQAKNVIDLESRGGGKSYLASSMILQNFLFDGAYDYDIYLENKSKNEPLTSDTVVGAIESKYSDDLMKKVRLAMEHLPDKQTINGELFPSPFFVSYSGSMMPGKTLTSATGTVINHRTFMDDPLAANGTRPNRAFLEEVGFMNNIVEVWGALESTQASADNKTLTIYALGTGGLTSHGAVQFTKDVFYNPEEYNCLAFDDIWENKGKIGYFVPATYTINKFKKGPNLITDEPKALEYVLEEIESAKKSGNRRKYMAEVINKPTKPSDIFLTVEGNFFPIEDLRIVLGELETNRRILDTSWKVQFYVKEGKVDWQMTDKPVLRNFPHRRGDILDTAIEIWELPKFEEGGRPPYGRYLASLDPVDNDGGDDVDHSLLSGFILDSWTDRIVVEYTGRTKITEDFYEQWRRCLIYYNALCNYERNLKGFYPHMKQNSSLTFLCDEPEILKEKGLVGGKSGIGNVLKGTHCTVPVENWGIELILNWLDQRAYGSNEEQDEDEEATIVKNLHQIKSPSLVQELIAYNNQINADRVSSLILLMILREDRLQITKNSMLKTIKTVSQHNFWDRAYKKTNMKFYKPTK